MRKFIATTALAFAFAAPASAGRPITPIGPIPVPTPPTFPTCVQIHPAIDCL